MLRPAKVKQACFLILLFILHIQTLCLFSGEFTIHKSLEKVLSLWGSGQENEARQIVIAIWSLSSISD